MNVMGVLGIIFVLAKIFGVGPIADWSWWLVLLPFYLGLAILLFAGFLTGVTAAVVLGIREFLSWFDRRK